MTEQTPVAAPAAPSPAPASNATPAPEAAVSVVATAPPVAPAEQPGAAVTAPVEAPKPVSILGAEAPKVEAPKTETPPETKAPVQAEAKVEETKKEEGTQSADPAPVPSYEAFKLPDGITIDNDRLGEFTKELAELEVHTKADHAKMQEFGQKLVDRHVAELKTAATRMAEHYQNAFEKMRNDWKDSFEKDPEIGGNRRDTTIGAALEFIRTHGGNEVQQKEFRELMDTTGVGNHPALIRLLAKANTVIREGGPLPATKPQLTATSKVAKRYGGTAT